MGAHLTGRAAFSGICAEQGIKERATRHVVTNFDDSQVVKSTS